jgi:hypothetical protein
VIQRDYILRIIEEIGAVWAHMVMLRRSGKHDEARVELNQTLERLLGFNLRSLGEMPFEKLLATVRFSLSTRATPEETAGLLSLLSDLTREGADLLPEVGEDAMLRDGLRMRALQLRLAAVLENEDTTRGKSAVTFLDELLEQLAEYELPLGVKDQLWRVYELGGAYAKAENWLFDLLEDERMELGPGHVAIKRGQAFYDRILILPDAALNAAGLPRDEAEAGLAELHEIAMRATE